MAGDWEYVWCYFRNLTHAIYREIRHIGPQGDYEAKCVIKKADVYYEAAKKCRRNRRQMKEEVLFREVEDNNTDAIITPYREISGLTPEDLMQIFGKYDWQHSYGGKKWAEIVEHFFVLKEAVDRDDLEQALVACQRIRNLSHNSGPLVPSKRNWKQSKWLQEKWPEWCEGDG